MITRGPAADVRLPREEAPRQGLARRVTRARATPLLPDDHLALVNPLWSARALRGRIVATRPVGRATTELTIRPGAGWAGHRPGQHVGVGVEIAGRRRWRTYSITSAPGAEHLTVSVTAIPDGSDRPRLIVHQHDTTSGRLRPSGLDDLAHADDAVAVQTCVSAAAGDCRIDL